MNGVTVIKRKSLRPKTGAAIAVESQKYVDPSHESERPRNPLAFTKITYTAALTAKPLWDSVPVTSQRIRQLLGDPTRICADRLEYVFRIPSREVLKVVLSSKGVSVHGYNRTPTVEKWVDRLLNA